MAAITEVVIRRYASYARNRAVFLNSTMVTVYKNNEERK